MIGQPAELKLTIEVKHKDGTVDTYDLVGHIETEGEAIVSNTHDSGEERSD